MWPRFAVALTQTTRGKRRRWKTGGFLRASTSHTFCFASHLVLLRFPGSVVSDVPQKALLRTSWTCPGRLQLRSRGEAEDHRGGELRWSRRGVADELAEKTMCFHSMSSSSSVTAPDQCVSSSAFKGRL